MGHISNSKEAVYRELAERLSKNPIGAPVNEYLMEILHRLYTETEAMVGSKFPLKPVPLDKIVEITGIKEQDLKKILEDMANKGLVLDLPRKNTIYYMLAPVVVGFFEYTFMRVREDIDMKELAELFENYFRSEGIVEDIFGTDTKMFRGLVYENVIPAAVETEVLSYEKASEIIRASGGGSLSMCSCRHKAQHLGKTCEAGAPVEDVCISLGNAAKWLISRGFARPASVDEMLQVLEKTEELGLVHLADNVLNSPTFLCNCCGCCCNVLRSIREKGVNAVQPSNFIPVLNEESCSECGTCAESCHIQAITMETSGDNSELPSIKEDLCIGCGVCASACPTGALTMERRSEIITPPQDKREHIYRMGKERGLF